MKKVLFITLILIFTTKFSSFAQINIGTVSDKDYKNAVVFSPFNLINPRTASLQLGYQRDITQNLIFQAEGFFIFDGLISIIDEYDYLGGGMRAELKHVIKDIKKDSRIKLYIAEELMYTGLETTREDTFFYNFYSSSKTNSDEVRLNVKFGAQFIFNNHFLIETFAGFGTGIKSVRHYNHSGGEIGPFFKNDFEMREGEYLMFYFPVNIKIGYKF